MCDTSRPENLRKVSGMPRAEVASFEFPRELSSGRVHTQDALRVLRILGSPQADR